MKTQVANSTYAIKTYLEQIYRQVDDVIHLGDFVFMANVKVYEVIVYTKPIDEEQSMLEIVDIKFK